MPSRKYEEEQWAANKLLLGLDESGYGCYAGSQFVAGCVFPSGYDFSALPGLNDSKKLTEEKRFELEPIIKRDALKWFVVETTAAEFDAADNKFWLRFIALRDYITIHRDEFPPNIMTLMDGNKALVVEGIENKSLTKGDLHCYTIAAASVLAKTAKDRQMIALDADFPQYGWVRNKGYHSDEHKAAIQKFGFTLHHRQSYCRSIHVDETLYKN